MTHVWRVPQRTPQAPQLLLSDRRLASHPSANIPLQSPKPALHTKPQFPFAHVVVALALGGHMVPHEPQFEVSFWRFRHIPPQSV